MKETMASETQENKENAVEPGNRGRVEPGQAKSYSIQREWETVTTESGHWLVTGNCGAVSVKKYGAEARL